MNAASLLVTRKKKVEQDKKRLYIKKCHEAQRIEKRWLIRIRTGSVRRDVVRLKV